MQGSSTHTFITFLLAGAAVGFTVYCLSYVFHVWQTRNFSSTTSRGKRLRRACSGFAIGLVLVAAGWVDLEFHDRTGYIDVNEVFVLYGHRGALVQSTTQMVDIPENGVVAEFDGPSERATLAMLDLHVEQAQQRQEAAMLGAPQLDSGVVQEQNTLRAHLLQIESLLQDVRTRRTQLEQIRNDTTSSFQKSDAELEMENTLASNDLADARSRAQLAEHTLSRSDSLLRSGFSTQVTHEMHEREKSSAGLAIERHQQRIVLALRRRTADAERFRILARQWAAEIAENSTLIEHYESKRQDSTQRLDELDRTASSDRARAGRQLQAEANGLDLEVKSLKAERQRLADTIIVRAPFAGKVIYRHPAPQLAAERMPILALARAGGFVVQLRLPTGEVESLKRAGPVRLTIEAPVLRQHLNARFLRAEAEPAEPSVMLVILQCELVPEVLPILASTQNRVAVHLDWSPPLTNSGLFLLGACISFAGMFAMIWCSISPREIELVPTINLGNGQIEPVNPVISSYLTFRFAHLLSLGLLDAALLARIEMKVETEGVQFSHELGQALLRRWPSSTRIHELSAYAKPELAPDVLRLLARIDLLPAGESVSA